MDQPLPVALSASWQPGSDELGERESIVRELGGADRIGRLHADRRLTFQEIGSIAGKATYDASGRVMTDCMPANGVLGRGTIDHRPVATYGDDFTVRGGSAYASIKGKYFISEKLAGEYRQPLMRSPFRSAEALLIEAIIDPRDTRPLLCEFTNMAAPLRTPGQSLFTMRP